MEAFYNGSRRNLAQDDIDGIRSIYGQNIEFITGSNNIGNTGVYGISETLPVGFTIAWNVNTPCITLTNNGNNVTLNNASFTGNFTLTATITNGCGTLVFNRVISASIPIPPNLTINGATTFCNGTSTYSLNGLPPCVTNVNWSFGSLPNHPNIATLSCTNCTSTTLTKINNGTALLIATVTYPNSPTTYTYQQYIGVGTPVFRGWYNSPTNAQEPLNPWTRANINATNLACYGIYITTSTDITANANVVWQQSGIPSGMQWNQIGNNLRFYFADINQEAFFTVTITNSCGTSSIRYRFTSVGDNCSGGNPLRVQVSPNPTTSTINVTLTDKLDLEKQKEITEIRLVDKIGNVKQKWSYAKGSGNQTRQVNVSSFPADIYTIMVFDGTNWTSEKFIKQ